MKRGINISVHSAEWTGVFALVNKLSLQTSHICEFVDSCQNYYINNKTVLNSVYIGYRKGGN